ncbi:MAG: hypothetical protein ACTSYH_15100 [Candidatus Heimdallarchaeaceae archaeon]
MISTNIMLFEGTPFREPIKLFHYNIGYNYDFFELGELVKLCRDKNRNSIIFQYGKRIYSSLKLKIPLQYKEVLSFPEQAIIHLDKTENSQDKLRFLLGEIIATFLRNQNWRADLRPGLVYQVEKLVASKEFRPLSIWDGFKYSPLIFDDGKAGLIIDPSYKIYWEETLRQLYDREKEKMPLHGDIVIDTCPNEDCRLKKDPFSICDLSSHGRGVKLVNINGKKTPKTAIIKRDDKDIDVYAYNNDIACPLGIMGASISENKKPVAIVNIGRSTKPYTYPLERLRKKADFSDIRNPRARRHLMRLIQPLPDERFRRTIEITENTLNSVIFGQFNLNFSSLINTHKTSNFEIKHNPPIEMQLDENKMSRNPALDLENDNPYDFKTRRFKRLIIKIITIGVSEKEFKDVNYIENTILNGEMLEENGEENSFNQKSEIIPSLSKYFSLDNVEILRDRTTIDVKKPKESKEILEKQFDKKKTGSYLKNVSSKTVFLRIYGKEASKYNTDYITDFLISKDVPNQGLSLEKYNRIRNDVGRVRGYFKNIYLGIYAKVGGIVWASPENIGEKHTQYFGYSSIFRENRIIFSLTHYDHRGLWKKGVGAVTTKEEFSKTLKKILTKNFPLSQSSQVVFHVRGKIKQNIELETFKGIFQEIGGKFRIIEFMESPIRLYKQERSRIASAKAGTQIAINSKQIAMLTYYFDNLKTKTPDPIMCHLAFGDERKFKKDINHAFYLTQCYTGYLQQQTKYPITAYSANKITEKMQNYEKSLNIEFISQWYI